MRKLLVALMSLALLGGCMRDKKANDHFTTQDRLDKGLVVILPGIEGESPFNHELRQGLSQAGVAGAMPIYNWGVPVPIAGALVNQMNVWGNRSAGKDLAKYVMEYQDKHPGRAVYLVGHSGGGGVAVFAAEAMPEGRKIDGLILLSASISSGYDLTAALARCRSGIVNFYSPADVATLGVATTIAGNVDGGHGPSAGLTGFRLPSESDSAPKQQAYHQLYQVQITGGANPHTAATKSPFVQTHVAPWLGGPWPANSLALDGD